jgi:hypothetical protein
MRRHFHKDFTSKNMRLGKLPQYTNIINTRIFYEYDVILRRVGFQPID